MAPGRKPRELRLLLDFPEAPQLSRSAGPAWGAGSNRRCPALFRTREQVSSQMKSSPNASFSKADRFYYDKTLLGPGTYEQLEETAQRAPRQRLP